VPVVTVPEIVWLTPLRLLDHAPWTRQPDGEELLVGDMMEPSEDAEASVSLAVREMAAFENSTPRIDARALRPYQDECVEAVFRAWSSGKKAPLIVMGTGCHRAGQCVLMYDGSTKLVEDVVVGDLLMGPDSKPRRVLRLCRGTGPMVRIIPTKGESWVVNDEHVLSLYKIAKNSAPAFPSEGARCIDMTVREYEGKSATFKWLAKLYRVGVDFPERDPGPIDPYFMGLYIADGSMAIDGHVGVSKPDPEVLAVCLEQAAVWGLQLRTRAGSPDRCPTHSFVGGSQGQVRVGGNRLLNELRGLGLMGIPSEARFIPDAYKLGSRKVREELLAGILDGDGSLGNGHYDWISKSERLANDLAFVVRSLGRAAYVKKCSKSCQGGFTGTYWRVSISGDLSHLPMRIPRKRMAPRRQIKSVLRTAFKTRRTGTVEPFYGFTLDGDQRYLLDDFTVTHNSGKTVCAAEIVRRLRAQHPGHDYRVWFLAHREELLDQTYRLIKLMVPEATCGIVQGARNDVGKFVTIGSVDTLAGRDTPAGRRRFEEATTGHNQSVHSIVARPPSVVILDEAHHATSPKWRRLVDWVRAANPNVLLLGMTATPGRTDGTALDAVFDGVAYERNAFQLIEDGYLVPPVGFRVNLNIDLDVIPTESGEFKAAPLSKVMNQPAINQAVVEGYQRYGDGRKLLAFCVDVQHAKDLAEQFRQMGIQARHIDGTMKKADRDAVKQAFTEGKIRILTSCDVITEGYDDPSAQGALFARPTNSQLVYIQALGRALRLHPSKRDALIIDCVGNSQKHQLAQLASLAGLADITSGDGKPKPAMEGPEIGDAAVGGIDAQRIDFRVLRQRASKWSWRETRFGWMVSIPRIGYFLLAWTTNDRRTTDIKFHDMREGKRDTPPMVLSAGMDFDMAYGLVEQEIERLFSARTSRARLKDKEEDAMGAARDVLEEGVSGELFSPEELMRSDANWRNNPTSERQRAALIDIGVKPGSVPATAGEASDLFSVMTIERNAKQREPATDKQKAMIVQQKLATYDEAKVMTKKQAAGLIVRFLKEKETKKNAMARFADDDAPPPTDEDAP
jgi:superfamily II DNA or RNA helicase